MAKYCLHLWEFMRVEHTAWMEWFWSFHQIKVVTFALSFNEKLFTQYNSLGIKVTLLL